MKMKEMKWLPFVLSLLMITFVFACSAMAQPPMEIAFGGSSPGGVFYYMVGVLSTMITDQVPQVNMTNVATGASVDNALKIMQSELDFGLSHASHTWQAYHGEGRFDGIRGSDNLKGIAYAYESPHYFVTLERTGIKTMEDLTGKRVSMGQPGSGAQFNSDLIIDILGYEMNREYLQFADAGRALRDGRIDAFGQSGAPSGAVSELAETENVVIIPFTKEEMETLLTEVSFYHENTMPKDTYRGMEEAALVPHFAVYWNGHKDVPDEIIYAILQTVFDPDNFRVLGEDHVLWRQLEHGVERYNVLNGPPMHPGALKFYEEMGWAN